MQSNFGNTSPKLFAQNQKNIKRNIFLQKKSFSKTFLRIAWKPGWRRQSESVRCEFDRKIRIWVCSKIGFSFKMMFWTNRHQFWQDQLKKFSLGWRNFSIFFVFFSGKNCYKLSCGNMKISFDNGSRKLFKTWKVLKLLGLSEVQFPPKLFVCTRINLL